MANVHKFSEIKSLKLINARGKDHIGLVKKDIAFNPLDINQEEIEKAIEKIFDSEVNDFVKAVLGIVSNIHAIN